MKKLYSFNVNKVKEVEETTDNADGSKTTKKVVKEMPVEIILEKPSRILREKASTFYKKCVSENIQNGIMTRAMFQKYLINGDGVLADKEKEDLQKKLVRMTELEYQFVDMRKTSDNTKKSQDELQAILLEYTEIQRELEALEFSEHTLFQNTAENDAQEKSLLWWILHISHLNEDSEIKPVFEGVTYEEKLESYDKLEEMDDPFYNKVLERVSFFVSLWIIGKANTEEDFQDYDEEYKKEQEPTDKPTDTPAEEKEKAEVEERPVEDTQVAAS